MIKVIESEHIANSAIKLTVEVSSEKTKETFDEIFLKYKTSIHYPGVRKGKVPENLIMRKMGAEIKKETAIKILEEASEQIIENIDPEPYSQPHLHDFPDIEPGKPWVFVLTYDYYPKFEVPDYKNLEIIKPIVKIGKKHIENELEVIRQNNSFVRDVPNGEVAPDSIVEMDYAELNTEGILLEDTVHKDFVLDMSCTIHPYKINEDIVSMKTGEKSVIEKKLNNKEIRVQVVIKKISERILPDLDNELAQDVSEEYKSLKDLKKTLNKELHEKIKALQKKMETNSIMLKLYDTTDIDIPVSMLEREVRNVLTQYNRTPESLDKEEKKYYESLARMRVGIWLISRKIIELEDIQVSKEELEVAMTEKYGNFDTEKPEIKQFIESSLENKMQQDRLFAFLLDSASIKKGPTIEFDEFMQNVEEMPDTGI